MLFRSGPNGVVRRQSDPLPPFNHPSTAVVTSTDRPATSTPPAAPDGGVSRIRTSGPRNGRAWVRGLDNARAAGLVDREDLFELAHTEVRPVSWAHDPAVKAIVAFTWTPNPEYLED